MNNDPNKSRAYKEDDNIHLMSAWRKLERSNCKLEERFENARAKWMQAEETANALALVEETALLRSMHSVHDVQCFANF
jgi:hypothetical protein